jgi:gluconate 5-dehydrogenase
LPDPSFDLRSFGLAGQRALVTGSTRGIGAAIAAGLARAGASVVLHGRDTTRVDAAAARLRADLGSGQAEIQGCAFDVTDHEAMITQARRADDGLGGIDILVNNAGMQFRSPLIDFPLARWDEILSCNLTSCFVLAQELARGMLARGHGKIINVCSVQNKLVRSTTAAYAVAKSGLGALSQAMCAEWAAGGIQANGLAPGYIDTELNASLRSDQQFDSWVRARTPARRWGTVADLVGPAVWLASSASDFVNGQVIYVDGGLTSVL